VACHACIRPAFPAAGAAGDGHTEEILILQIVLALAFTSWGGLALWVRKPGGPVAGRVLLALWLAAACFFVAGFFMPQWPALRPSSAGLYLCAVVLMLAWWVSVRPSNDRDWIPDVACQTQGTVDGDLVTLENVRNFHWRSADDFDARWETRIYDLRRLQSTDLVLSYWMHPGIAHALVSFGFEEHRYVVFSVEIRRKKGDKFSTLGGFFRQYELSVVAADERDILLVRTNMRGEDSYIYRVPMPPEAMKSLFLAYVRRANRLVGQPRFYNTITANCTTIIFKMMNRIVPGLPLDYRLVASGYLPEYLYDLGALQGAASVAEYRSRGRYTGRALAEGDTAGFSAAIRRGVPGIEPQQAAGAAVPQLGAA
jgi:hypothetical protein